MAPNIKIDEIFHIDMVDTKLGTSTSTSRQTDIRQGDDNSGGHMYMAATKNGGQGQFKVKGQVHISSNLG